MAYVGLGQAACTLTDYLTLANLWNGCVPTGSWDIEPTTGAAVMTQTLPTVGPQYGSSPTPPAGYSATYSGTDANGNPVYVYEPSAETIHAAQVSAITNQTAQNQPVDCTQWYNTFNPACGCTNCTPALIWAGIALAALLAYGVLKK